MRIFTNNFYLMLLLAPGIALAQVPVDEDGNEIGAYEPQYDDSPTTVDGAPLSASALEELVGPVALYPDDLLAIVLPASAYPLQIASAARFLERLEDDPSLKPDPEWDDSVVALTNYPEVIELMNGDLDWTYRLGEAVVTEQTAVVAAVEAFRDRAYAAGNLKSDEYQTVSQDDGVIEISPIEEDVIYVPYYEPRRVVVYQPRPVYYYHPRRYPVYYYPYASSHYFDHGYFWGVTTAFSIGWFSDSLHTYHHSYHGHPYYGRSYYNNWWYRRPSINVYNTTYVNNRRHASNRDGYANRLRNGDRWQPRESRRNLIRDQRQARTTQSGGAVPLRRQRDNIQFREREGRPISVARNNRASATNRSNTRNTTARTRGGRVGTSNSREQLSNRTTRANNGRGISRERNPDIAFRDRSGQAKRTTNNRTERPPTVQRNNTTTTGRTTARRETTTVERRTTGRVATTRQPVVRQSPQRSTERRSTSSRQNNVSRQRPKPSARTQQREQQPVRRSQSQRSQPQRSQPQRSQPQRSAQPQRSSAQPARAESRQSSQRSESRGKSRNQSRSSRRG